MRYSQKNAGTDLYQVDNQIYDKTSNKIVSLIYLHQLNFKIKCKIFAYCRLMNHQLNHKWLLTDDKYQADLWVLNTELNDTFDDHLLDRKIPQVFIGKSNFTSDNTSHCLQHSFTSKEFVDLLNQISANSQNRTKNSKSKKCERLSEQEEMLKSLKNSADKRKSEKVKSNITRLHEHIGKIKNTSKKIVFLGRSGVGKTTAIKSASGVNAITTDVNGSDSTSLQKKQTTVGIDYGTMLLNNKYVLNLYGTPGQERFDYMWDLTLKNSDAIFIMLDRTSDNILKDFGFYYNYIHSKNKLDRKIVCVITHNDVRDIPPINEGEVSLLNNLDIEVQYLDCRVPEQVKLLLADIGNQLFE